MIAGDLGISRSTALRRVAQAREQVRERLTEAVGADAVGTPYETVNSRPLARSQRLEEKQRGPTVGSVPGPGPMR